MMGVDCIIMPKKKDKPDGGKISSIYWMTEEEHDLVAQRAASLGLNLSQFVRRVAVANAKAGGPMTLEPETKN